MCDQPEAATADPTGAAALTWLLYSSGKWMTVP
jgi:hypothetical protein